MRVVITGSKGLLGSCLTRALRESNIEVIEASLPEYDVTLYSSLTTLFNKPVDYLINCSAFTDVPGAETDKESAYALNAQACALLAKICFLKHIHLIHFSTDFVFDGLKGSPYTERDTPNPINYYGESKLQGEKLIENNIPNYTIFRLQWLFGKSQKTFFSKILENSKTDNTLKIVQDEIGSPCSVEFVSSVIRTFLQTADKTSFLGQIYNLTHTNHCSRYECAKYFLDQIGWKGTLTPVLTSDFPSTVARPKYGALNTDKLAEHLQVDLATWESDIDNFIRSL